MIKSLKIFFTGFKGFGQLENEEKTFNKFKDVELKYVDTKPKLDFVDIDLTWNYLAVATNNILYLSGFIENNLNEHQRIAFECNISKVRCSAKYCLVLLTSGILYKVEISSKKTTELNSIMLSNEPIAKKKNMFNDVITKNMNEIITKIASGRTMSVALSNLNNLYNIPTKIFNFPSHVKVKKICCGNEHCLILTTNGDVYAFGSSSRGQLGIDSLNIEETPVLIEALAGIKIIDIAAGGWHSAAISAFNDLYMWGWNVNGQLGLPIYRGINEKTLCKKSDKIKNATVFVSPVLIDLSIENGCDTPTCVFAGERHTVVTTQEEIILVAGWNKYNQLGFQCLDDENQDAFKIVNDISMKKNDKIICGDWSTIYIPNL